MSRSRWLGIAAACLAAGACYIVSWSVILQHRANWALHNVATLYGTDQRTPTFARAQELFGGKLRPTSGCKSEGCEYRYELNNRALSRIHWVPFAEIQTSFWVENGYVRTSVIDVTSAANRSHSVVAHLYIQDGGGPIDNDRGLEFDLDPWEESSPQDTNGIVGVSPDSLRAHEPEVLGFDVGCLTRHRGCATVADMLPPVWQLRNDGKIRCLLKNREGFIESPWTGS